MGKHPEPSTCPRPYTLCPRIPFLSRFIHSNLQPSPTPTCAQPQPLTLKKGPKLAQPCPIHLAKGSNLAKGSRKPLFAFLGPEMGHFGGTPTRGHNSQIGPKWLQTRETVRPAFRGARRGQNGPKTAQRFPVNLPKGSGIIFGSNFFGSFWGSGARWPKP